MSEPAGILVLAPNWLGDAVMALPAIADVRRAFPSARIVVAARRPVADVFALAPGIDEVVTLGWNGRWWARRALAGDATRLREAGADVALLFPNSFASAWLARQADVPERWGYRADLRGVLLSRAVRRPGRSVHQGAYYQHLTHALGIERGPLEPVLLPSAGGARSARELLIGRGWNGSRPVVVLAPGAAYGTAKRWPPAYVGRLVCDLVARHEATAVIVGSRADAETAREVIGAVDPHALPHAIDLTGETTLDTLAGLLALGRVCVSNDSGAMHMAAAIGTPVVAVFGPTREHETAPLARTGVRTAVLTHPVWCRPCMLRTCPIDHRCMTRVPPARVFDAVAAIMEEGR